MLKVVLIGFLLISASFAENTTGKVCGTAPWTFRCPANTQCGTYTNRLCLSESQGPNLTGIIVFVVIAVLILLMVIKACLPCCPRCKGYRSVSSDSAYLARSGAVVCTVAATHC